MFVTRRKFTFVLTIVTFPNLIHSRDVQKKLSKTNVLQCVLNNKHIIGCSNLGENISFITSDQVLSEISAPLVYMDGKEENQSIHHLFTYKLKHKTCSKLSLWLKWQVLFSAWNTEDTGSEVTCNSAGFRSANFGVFKTVTGSDYFSV